MPSKVEYIREIHCWDNSPKRPGRRRTKDQMGVTVRGFILAALPDTLANFQRMATLAKKDFPLLDDERIICGKIKKSSDVHGFAVISFEITGNNAKSVTRLWRRLNPDRHRYTAKIQAAYGEWTINADTPEFSY